MAITNADKVQKSYIAYYGRPADPGGLTHWVGQLDKGVTFDVMLRAFGTSVEATTVFGNKTNEDTVKTLYQQILGRTPDSGGLAFYVGKLEDGSMTGITIAQNVFDGATGSDATMVSNKLAVAKAFNTSLDTEEKKAAYTGADAVFHLRKMLESVDSSTDPASIDFDTTIQNLVNDNKKSYTAIKEAVSSSETVVISEAAASSHLAVTTHSDSGYELLTRKIDVFGIGIYAADGVAESKLIHAAHVLAEYLDNDEDGVVDNQLVVDAIIGSKATVGLWKNEGDLDVITEGQRRYTMDLGDTETRPEWHVNNQPTAFDASLEEILHSITQNGYALAYPEVFGEKIGTSVADGMDVARGGQFIDIPEQYPESAWYSYQDSSCDYMCMITEYMYWGLSSILGAQDSRLDVIGQEWKLNTAELVETNDPTLYNLLTDDQYKFPTHLPDGSYAYAG
jgi:hypothetical protein